MRHYDLEMARSGARFWDADPGSVEHVATSGNAVYRFRCAVESVDDGWLVLRLAAPEHRSYEEHSAEMEFVAHLVGAGVQAASPRRTLGGRWVERVGDASASVVEWVPGEAVDARSELWGSDLFREWGRHLGRIHSAAVGYAGPPRFEWSDEYLVARAKSILPAGDTETRAVLAECLRAVAELPRSHENYGHTHADFAPQNFRYDREHGLTSFDFGNCCRHWFVHDLAISLLNVWRQANRDEIRREILTGYRQVHEIDIDCWRALPWFLRLRLLYVYLSRLQKWGATPSPQEAAQLAEFRRLATSSFEWVVPGEEAWLAGSA